jgi:hypothetical protein
MLLRVVGDGLTNLKSPYNKCQGVVKRSAQLLMQSLDALWHDQEARAMHAESAMRVLNALIKAENRCTRERGDMLTMRDQYTDTRVRGGMIYTDERHGDEVIGVELAIVLERHADALLQWEKDSREDVSSSEVTATVCNQVNALVQLNIWRDCGAVLTQRGGGGGGGGVSSS